MFYAMEKEEKQLASVLLGLASYLLFTLVFGMGELFAHPEYRTFFKILPELWWVKLLLSALIVILLVWVKSNNINIEARKVGQGQHGTARWASEKEKTQMYASVKRGHEKKPGFLLEYRNGWLVDTSDSNAMLAGPPGAGKTKRLFIPSIYYNALVNLVTHGNGASMILTDCKGELVKKCGAFLTSCGVRVMTLNFATPLQSLYFNLLNNVNTHINGYRIATTESARLLHYGRAERYAKILSSSIVENMGEVQKSDSGSYFTETAKGLLTGMILLVSEYGEPDERHIISVFRLIIEMNGLTDDSTQGVQKSRLQELLGYVDNDRIRNYVGPATSADVRTSMNVFSSALGKLVQFIDAELEPMVCNHSSELNDIDFIKQPTAIFLVCPDSNTTRHFFASLFIRYMMNDLIEQADANESLKLDRDVLCFWDEFGNMPPVKDIDTLISAARSRGIRFLLSLQSYAQLEKSYDRTMAKIIKDCCQMTISTYVSPNSRETAEEISRVLGSKTIQSGSVTKGHGYTQTVQMMGRRLLTEDEVMAIPQGDFIILKGGCPPSRTKLPMYWDYMPEYPDYAPPVAHGEIAAIKYLTADKIRQMSHRERYKLRRGMFDEVS